jgi:hypothetical protein
MTSLISCFTKYLGKLGIVQILSALKVAVCCLKRWQPPTGLHGVIRLQAAIFISVVASLDITLEVYVFRDNSRHSRRLTCDRTMN